MNNKEFIKTAIKRILKKKMDYDMPDECLDIKNIEATIGQERVNLHLDINLDISYADLLELWKN